MKQVTPWSTSSSRGYAIAHAYLRHRRVFPHVPASMALAFVRMVTL
jgi:hypothetical protein